MKGARVGTITNLLRPDVDHDNREMTFPINREVAALLSALPRSNVLRYRGHVFTRPNRQTLERQATDPHGGIMPAEFSKALRDVEIEAFRFNDLRHTFAARLLRKTQNIKLVSKLLGHSSIETTTKYAHVLLHDLRDALDDYLVLGDGPTLADPPQCSLSFSYEFDSRYPLQKTS